MSDTPEAVDPAFQRPLPSSILRACFWRSYDSLGTLVALGAVGSAFAAGLLLVASKIWARFPFLLGRAVLAIITALALSAVLAYLGRKVFSCYIDPPEPWRPFFPGRWLSDTGRVFILEGGTLLLGALCFNNLVLYLDLAHDGYGWGRVLAAFAGMILGLLALSSIWHFPLLFFRPDPAWRVAWRALLLLLSNPIETVLLGLSTGSAWVLMGTVPAAQVGLILGLPFLLALPTTALEKILWTYRITRDALPPQSVWNRWSRESKRGWRDILKPWETR